MMQVNQKNQTVASDPSSKSSATDMQPIFDKLKANQDLSPSELTELQNYMKTMASGSGDPQTEFNTLLEQTGITGNSSASGASSSAYEGMSIQEKIFALMLATIDSQEKSLESRFELIAGQKDKVDTLNKANAALGDLSGQLDPADPEDTIDITDATIQIADENGNMKDVNVCQYLKDSGYEITDPKNMNATGLSALQSAVKDGTESLNATSQTDLLKLQTESSKLSRLYEMTTAMMKSFSDSAQGITRNL